MLDVGGVAAISSGSLSTGRRRLSRSARSARFRPRACSYAVDAATGRRLWCNNTGGESPQSRISPQGYLLASANLRAGDCSSRSLRRDCNRATPRERSPYSPACSRRNRPGWRPQEMRTRPQSRPIARSWNPRSSGRMGNAVPSQVPNFRQRCGDLNKDQMLEWAAECRNDGILLASVRVGDIVPVVKDREAAVRSMRTRQGS